MCSMANFYTSSVETLRRELVGYGAVISNLANVAQRQRMEIAIIARNIISAVPPTNDEKATTTTDAEATKAKEATTSTDADATATAEAITLSRSWLKLIDAHECLCEDCKPEYHEILRSIMMKENKTI